MNEGAGGAEAPWRFFTTKTYVLREEKRKSARNFPEERRV